tara:strand:- start:1847 stop:2557 length:711 start_codon:yes stop_codon:yes gene_type:complete
MSAKYTFLAWDTAIKNAPLKLALLQLANNADDDGFSYYSISKMAISCGMSDRTFMRKIAELEDLKILSVERRSNRPSLYTLIGDEMGVTLCHLQNTEVTACHGGVTESHLVGDRESHDLNSTLNTTPESKDIAIIPQKFDFKKELLALGVDNNTLSDWLAVRAKKKAVNSQTALNGLLSEIRKAGITPNEAVKISAENSWSGFKAIWYQNTKKEETKGDILQASANSDWHLQDQGF